MSQNIILGHQSIRILCVIYTRKKKLTLIKKKKGYWRDLPKTVPKIALKYHIIEHLNFTHYLIRDLKVEWSKLLTFE